MSEPREIEWHEVVESDHLMSRKNKKFYEVTNVLKLRDGTRRITVAAGTARPVIVRPTKEEPKAIVKRGPTGRAVDVIVDVLSSGGGNAS